MSPSTNPLVLDVESPPVAEAATWLQCDKFGSEKPLIDLCQAVPGYSAHISLRNYVAECAKDPNSAFYTDIEGKSELRAALAADITAVYGGKISANEVLISQGCNQAFFLTMISLAPAGSSVILPVPWYFNHKMALDMLGVEVIPLPCSIDNGMLPDFKIVEGLVRSNTRAIILVSPNNPTGAVYPDTLIKKFMELCASHGLALVLDETYRDFLEPGIRKPHSLFNDPKWRSAGLVHLYSFSKVFSMTGYRAGAVVTSSELISQIAKVMDCMSICTATLAQEAALYGLKNLRDWRDEKCQLMSERVKEFKRAFSEKKSDYKICSIGAYFAYVQHPFPDKNAKDVAKALAAEQNLLCLPGSMFGPDQEKMLRFAFANVDACLISEIRTRLDNATIY